MALVKAAMKAGQVLVDTRESKYFVEDDTGRIKSYIIHAEFKFDSDRKRMSVIVEEDGEFYLYTKGADNKMLPVIKFDSKSDEEVLKEQLYDFAVQGLRTLVMGKKKMSKQEFNGIMDGIHQIQASESKNKEAQYTELYIDHEKNLEFIGASAIEDKLQDNVPQTIAKLMEANIRVWVLTGDKQETAIEIAKSCQLIQEDMTLVNLTIKMADNKPNLEESENHYNQRIAEIQRKYKDELLIQLKQAKKEHVDPCVELKDPDAIFKAPLKDLVKEGAPLTMVIDGPTLALILGDEELERAFLCVGVYTKSVVCCRVSPKQKSMVVALLKKYKKGCIRLSIGDGANDVPMIMEANIGVGIRGKEGTQAVRSADYAISQFQYLQKLMLFHGRLGYRRVSWVVCYYFYKNIVLVFTEIYFAFYNGFSGQIYFADWLPMLYNSLWTSLT